MTRSTRFFVRGGVLLARLAPPALRSDLQSDGAVVLASICERAESRGGWLALWRTGLAEWFNLLLTAWRARRGRLSIVDGAPLSPGGPRKRRTPKIRRDFRQAWRGLTATPWSVALAALTLALGIGVNTAVFSILDSVLFRPVPYVHADRLVALWSYYAPGKFHIQGEFSSAAVVQWRKQTDLFDRVEASQTKSLIFAGDRGPVMVRGALVTPGLLSMLGVNAQSGRMFSDGEGRGGTSDRAIVSDRFWREHLASDANVLGRSIVLDGARYDVVGVMPSSFRYPDETHELWLPFDDSQPPPAAFRISLSPVARMKSGLARAEVAERVIARGESVTSAAGGEKDLSARVQPIGELFDETTARSLWVLGAAVVFLLLIVCANVANLTLARSMARTRDLAVRAALGASRGDLFRVAFLEHLLLGAGGAAVGLLLASIAIGTVVGVLPSEITRESLNAIDLDWRTLVFLVSSTVATVLMFGLPPAWLASRSSVTTALSRESRASTGSAFARRLRGSLVILEVALSIVLLVGAALMTRSMLKLQAIDIGLNPSGLVKLTIGFPSGVFDDLRGRDLATAEIVRHLQQSNGIVRASAGSLPPGEAMFAHGLLRIDEGEPATKKETALFVFDTWPGFFATAGIALLEGREPTEGDVQGAAVVSRDFAEKHWPGRSALGGRFQWGKHPARTVVGVAAEIRRMNETAQSARPEIYFPHDQVAGVIRATQAASAIKESRSILVRLQNNAGVFRELAKIVHAADPRVIVSDTTFVERQFADAIARPRIVFLMMTIFAGVGLVLAAAGLYGVLSYLVSLRQREIGVRLALGARPADVGRLVLRSGVALAGVGVIFGMAGAFALVRLMRTLLYDVEPSDPVAVGVVIAVIVATAVAASLIPARRAMKIDPVELLRES